MVKQLNVQSINESYNHLIMPSKNKPDICLYQKEMPVRPLKMLRHRCLFCSLGHEQKHPADTEEVLNLRFQYF